MKITLTFKVEETVGDKKYVQRYTLAGADLSQILFAISSRNSREYH